MSASPPEQAVWTVGKVLTWTTDDFQKRGLRSPRLDAELLLAAVLGCDRVGLYLDYHKPLTPGERKSYRALVSRRQNGEPVAYLLGRKEFWSLPFQVDPRVLVPRPETELLVETALDLLGGEERPHVVDVGTGSGAVAVAFAHERADAVVVATDLSDEVLELARKNAEQNGVAVDFRKGRGLDPVRGEGRAYHLILSNPPYVSTADLDSVAPDVLAHEPRGALLAGPEGLDVIRVLVEGGPEVIRDGGALVCEMDPSQEDPVRELVERDARYSAFSVRRDLAGRSRVFVASI